MYFLHFIHIFFRVHFFILNFFTCLAFFRHTAGYCWAYNTRTFFQFYYPKFDIGLWTFCASVFGGSFGVFAGGFFSDRFTSYKSYLILSLSLQTCEPSRCPLPPVAAVCLHTAGRAAGGGHAALPSSGGFW